ncbi:MAG TPA: NADH-quinone oxidoreductase subunit J [Anaeromyxobacteraceae bacterium]|nr:NADH-quinone oxidoreductase subunit J [Anaeromyxobacteraceae bacterium]
MRSHRKLLAWSVASLAVLGAVAVASAHLSPALAASPGPFAGGRLSLADLVFWFLAALAVAGAAGVALSRNILYTSLALLFSLLGVGGLYVYLSADFLAVAQVLIYIGGVLVLILFAVMLTSRIGDVNISNTSLGWAGGAIVTAVIGLLVVVVAVEVPWRARDVPLAPTTAQLGNGLLQGWLLPFELASLILLATMIGAIVIARKELKAD